MLALHSELIRRHGGHAGIRDQGLLESAISMPAATFDGEHLHATLFEMAAAYLFHLARNHPFLDGNKRIALAAALVFLRMNGLRVRADEDEVYRLVMDVAEGRLAKADAAVFLQAHAAKVRRRPR